MGRAAPCGISTYCGVGKLAEKGGDMSNFGGEGSRPKQRKIRNRNGNRRVGNFKGVWGVRGGGVVGGELDGGREEEKRIGGAGRRSEGAGEGGRWGEREGGRGSGGGREGEG